MICCTRPHSTKTLLACFFAKDVPSIPQKSVFLPCFLTRACLCTVCSAWRNRAEFPRGRDEIEKFLERKWAKELEYRLIKELWAHDGNRIAVRFAYEWRDDSGSWFRSHGNENWEFDDKGLMARRFASINDMPITAEERKYHWPEGQRRPDDHPGLSDLGL
jgi:nuclear transport factor 2 (NTF2) superfamily protein